MSKFLNYYNKELEALRIQGGFFAKKHPEVAELIDLKNAPSTDPQTERIIEAAAFIGARLNKKIDDNASYLAALLLETIHPNIVNVFPPCSVCSFEPKSAVSASQTTVVKKGTTLSANIENRYTCTFKTVYDIHISPIQIKDIKLNKLSSAAGSKWALQIDIESLTVPLRKMDLNSITFHIFSELIDNSLILYESIFSDHNVTPKLLFGGNVIEMTKDNIRAMGFDENEPICPKQKYTTNAYSLFQEIIYYPNKFMFFEIKNISNYIKQNISGEEKNFSIVIPLNNYRDNLKDIINKNVLKLHCSPIVNLFELTTDPIRFNNTKNRQLLMPDQLRDESLEIRSISELHFVDSKTFQDNIIQPYFSLQVDSYTNIKHDLFWISEKESAEIRNLSGYDTYISLINTNIDVDVIYDDTVYAKTLCTNRFKTRDLPVYKEMIVEKVETGAFRPLLLYKTSTPKYFNRIGNSLWAFISQLSSAQITIESSDNLAPFFKQMMELITSAEPYKAEDYANNIADITSESIVRRISGNPTLGFVKGSLFNISIKDESMSYRAFLISFAIKNYLSIFSNFNTVVELILTANKNTNKIFYLQ